MYWIRFSCFDVNWILFDDLKIIKKKEKKYNSLVSVYFKKKKKNLSPSKVTDLERVYQPVRDYDIQVLKKFFKIKKRPLPRRIIGA